MPVLGMGVPNRNVRIGAPKPHTRMFGLLRMTPKLGTTQASIAVERPGLELPRGNENAPSAAPRRTAGGSQGNNAGRRRQRPMPTRWAVHPRKVI